MTKRWKSASWAHHVTKSSNNAAHPLQRIGFHRHKLTLPPFDLFLNADKTSVLLAQLVESACFLLKRLLLHRLMLKSFTRLPMLSRDSRQNELGINSTPKSRRMQKDLDRALIGRKCSRDATRPASSLQWCPPLRDDEVTGTAMYRTLF